ncbi:MAG: mraZ [Opitutales bacterium]|nr:mraZ [Opitutales bacterium]MCH8539966.1 mraZ [Opitutales bacterium]
MTSPAKTMYVGSFRHNLDAKNRLTVPSKWRFAGDQEDVYLAIPHPNGYIMVLPPAEVERLQQQVMGVQMGDDEGQALLNQIFAVSSSMGCDKQGRISLTDQLVLHAGIKKEAMLVGTMTKFGIWLPEKWEKQNQAGEQTNLSELMRKIGF